MLQMFHWKYTLKESVSSPAPHSTDFSLIFHKLAQSLDLNMALWAVLAWLTKEPIVEPGFHQSPPCTQPRSVPRCEVKYAKDISKPQLRWSVLSDQLIATNSTNSTGCHCNNWYKLSPLVIKRRSKTQEKQNVFKMCESRESGRCTIYASLSHIHLLVWVGGFYLAVLQWDWICSLTVC